MAIPVTGLGGPLLAWALAYIKPSMGLPSVEITLAWVVINLFVVCTVEEGAFFRGVVQRGLGRAMPPALDSGGATALSRKA
jgi:membrane protease YdiL (CAAX protease family)